MGAYLSEPITTKEIETEENELMAVVACSMQGWRVSQEVNFKFGSSFWRALFESRT